MENLNDLIWTDEDCNENGEAGTMGTEMYKICLVAFCDGIVCGGDGGNIGSGLSTQANYACGRTITSHSAPCH